MVAALVIPAEIQLQTWRNAETLFMRAREISPENPLAFHELALVAEDRGDMARAAALEEHALAVDSTYVDAHYGLGLLLANAGRFEEACVQFRKALRVKPTSSNTWYFLGRSLRELGRASEADSCLARSRTLRADSAAIAARRP